MSRVIVPSLRFKNTPEGFVPATDISAAERYGEFIYLTKPGNEPLTQDGIDTIVKRMEDVKVDDIILLTGDIVVCSIAIGEMAARFDKFRVLRWHSRDSMYSLEEWKWSLYDDEDFEYPLAAE